jgi:hypothetical protein
MSSLLNCSIPAGSTGGLAGGKVAVGDDDSPCDAHERQARHISLGRRAALTNAGRRASAAAA